MVRVEEVSQSLVLVHEALKNLPTGNISVSVKSPASEGKYTFRVEQPRGETFYYVQGNGTKNFRLAKVRTPTNINIPVMVKVLQGCNLQDVSMLVITIDLCINCTER